MVRDCLLFKFTLASQTLFVVHRTEGEGITAGRLYGVTAFKVGGSIKISMSYCIAAFIILYLPLTGGPYHCWEQDCREVENEDGWDYGRRYIDLHAMPMSVESANILYHIPAAYDFMSKEQATSSSEFLGDCLRLLTHTFTTLQPLPVS